MTDQARPRSWHGFGGPWRHDGLARRGVPHGTLESRRSLNDVTAAATASCRSGHVRCPRRHADVGYTEHLEYASRMRSPSPESRGVPSHAAFAGPSTSSAVTGKGDNDLEAAGDAASRRESGPGQVGVFQTKPAVLPTESATCVRPWPSPAGDRSLDAPRPPEPMSHRRELRTQAARLSGRQGRVPASRRRPERHRHCTEDRTGQNRTRGPQGDAKAREPQVRVNDGGQTRGTRRLLAEALQVATGPASRRRSLTVTPCCPR